VVVIFVTMTINLCLITMPCGLVRLVPSFQTKIWCVCNLILKTEAAYTSQTLCLHTRLNCVTF